MTRPHAMSSPFGGGCCCGACAMDAGRMHAAAASDTQPHAAPTPHKAPWQGAGAGACLSQPWSYSSPGTSHSNRCRWSIARDRLSSLHAPERPRSTRPGQTFSMYLRQKSMQPFAWRCETTALDVVGAAAAHPRLARSMQTMLWTPRSVNALFWVCGKRH